MLPGAVIASRRDRSRDRCCVNWGSASDRTLFHLVSSRGSREPEKLHSSRVFDDNFNPKIPDRASSLLRRYGHFVTWRSSSYVAIWRSRVLFVFSSSRMLITGILLIYFAFLCALRDLKSSTSSRSCRLLEDFRASPVNEEIFLFFQEISFIHLFISVIFIKN